MPQSKRVRFTEAGAPAVNRGTNQPNVFYDPKSSESFLPYFSRGYQDDLVQRRYIEALYTAFTLTDDADPTKKALFELSSISTGTTRTFTLPNTTSELAILAGTQTFTGNKTFSGTLTASGTVTVSAAAATIGTATTTATYGVGTGATTTGVTKTVNLGTGGASGSTTVVNIGPVAAGAGGTTVWGGHSPPLG